MQLEILRDYGRGKKVFTISSVEKATSHLLDEGYALHTMEEGCCGLGNYILTPPDEERMYAFVIEETALNCWTSGQTVRRFQTKNIPQKFWDRVEKFGQEVFA